MSSSVPALHSVPDPASIGLMEEKKRKINEKEMMFLPRNTNQARGIADYAIQFINKQIGNGPAREVIDRTELFHLDSVVCGYSALALGTNAPTVLRAEAEEEYGMERGKNGAKCFGSKRKCYVEKAIVANVSAVREWDSNGTVFGYNNNLGPDHKAGEFGHNDFYPVVIAACQIANKGGETAIRGMIAIDEIRGRLAEVFSLKTYHIDHVVHGAIASAAVYGAIVGATIDQIESAIGMVVAHYIPFRAIRAGEQLSDSKGASAAISSEVAIMSVNRSMRGFVGPADIFRNPEAIFRKFKPTQKAIEGDSPFDLVLAHSGKDFAVMGMHFKLGLYEHQSAGAIQGMINLIASSPSILKEKAIKKITVVAYQPAFGIIGDPAKRNPTTRQSADHSMVFILSRLLQRAQEIGEEGLKGLNENELWQKLMLLPIDYSRSAVKDERTRKLMDLIEFQHGGQEYDSKYPEGIPTSIVITTTAGEGEEKQLNSGLIMFPAGHAANTQHDLQSILSTKFKRLAELGVGEQKAEQLIERLKSIESKSAKEIEGLYEQEIAFVRGGNTNNNNNSKGSGRKTKKHKNEEGKEGPEVEVNEY